MSAGKESAGLGAKVDLANSRPLSARLAELGHPVGDRDIIEVVHAALDDLAMLRATLAAARRLASEMQALCAPSGLRRRQDSKKGE